MRDGGNLSAAIRLYFIDHQHRGRQMSLLKIFTEMFSQNRRSKRPKRLALFYSLIQNILHAGPARIAKDGTIAQSAGPKFHTSLKPANHKSIGDITRRFLDQFRV